MFKKSGKFSVTPIKDSYGLPTSTVKLTDPGLEPKVKKPLPKIKSSGSRIKKVKIPKKQFNVTNEFLTLAKEQGIVKTIVPNVGITNGQPIGAANFNINTSVAAQDIKGIDELQVPLKYNFPGTLSNSTAIGNIIFNDAKNNFYGYIKRQWLPFIQGLADVLAYNNDAGGYSIVNLGDVYSNGNIYATTFIGNFISMERVGYPNTVINPNIVTTMIDNGNPGIVDWVNRIGVKKLFLASNAQGSRIAINNVGYIAATGITDTSPIEFYSGTTIVVATLAVSSYNHYLASYSVNGGYNWATYVTGCDQNLNKSVATNILGETFITGNYSSNPLTIYTAGNPVSVANLSPSGFSDAYLIKYNNLGKFQWVTKISGTVLDFFEYVYNVSTNDNGDVLITGSYSSPFLAIYNTNEQIVATLPNPNVFSTNGYIVKYNTSGQYQWATILGGVGVEEGTSIDVNNDGDIVVTGYYNAPGLRIYDIGGQNIVATLPSFGSQVFIVKYDMNGTYKWATALNGPGPYCRISVNNFGNIVVCGYVTGLLSQVDIYNIGGTSVISTLPVYSGLNNACVIKYDSDGNYLLGTILTSVKQDSSFIIDINDNDRIILTGGFTNTLEIYGTGATTLVYELTSSGNSDAFVVMYGGNCDYQWVTKIAGANADEGLGVSMNNKGQIIATGYYSGDATVYDGNNNPVVQLPFKYGTDAFVVEYKDEILNLTLANPTFDGQTKIIVSTGPNVVVDPQATIDGENVNLELSKNQYVQLLWDATQQNWISIYNSGGGIQINSDLDMNGYSILNTNNLYAQYIFSSDIFTTNLTANVVTASLLVGNLSSCEFIGYPATTISTDVITSYISTGFGYSPWGARISGIDTEYGYGSAINNYHNIVSTGRFNSAFISVYNANGSVAFNLFRLGFSDAYVVKWNSAGIAQWGALIAGIFINDFGIGIAQNDMNMIAATGIYESNPLRIYNSNGSLAFTLPNPFVSYWDVYITLYDSAGFAKWASRIVTFDYTYICDIDINNNNDVVSICNFSDNYVTTGAEVYNSDGNLAFTIGTSGNYDCLITKWNSLGFAQWGTKVAGVSDEVGFGIAINDNGDIAATGIYSSNPISIYNAGGTVVAFSLSSSGGDVFVVKWNSAGTAQWGAKVSIAGFSYDFGPKLDLNYNGDIVVTGFYYSNPAYIYNSDNTVAFVLPYSGGGDAFIAKWNSDGRVIFATRIAGVSTEYGTNISINDNSDVISTCWYNSNPLYIYNTDGSIGLSLSGTTGSLIVKWSIMGNPQWVSRIAGNVISYDININNFNEIALSGYYSSLISIYNSTGALAYTLANVAQDSFVLKFLDEISLNLATPSERCQEKVVTSIGPKTIIGPITYNGVPNTTFTIYNGDVWNVLWDSTNKNWINKDNVIQTTRGNPFQPAYSFIGNTNTGMWSPGTDKIAFSTGGFERMRIGSNGYVGIGTNTPSYTLHVVGSAGLSTGTAWINASDERLKDIHGSFDKGLTEILELTPIRYNYKQGNPLGIPSDFEKVGFSAQSVQKVIPEAVTTDSTGFLQLNVDPIHWALVNAVKELHKEVQSLRQELKDLKKI